MHVGVCMRIKSSDLDLAKAEALSILHGYSQDDETRDVDIRLSFQDFLKSWKINENLEMDDDSIKLLIETGSKEEIYYDLLEDNFLDRCYYDLDFHELKENMTPFIKAVLEIFEDSTEEELESAIIFNNNPNEGDGLFIDGDKVVICFGVQFTYGYWDYTYGISEHFGLADDENGSYKIWTCNGKEINKKFINKLFDDNCSTKACQVVEFWVDENRNVYNESQIEDIRKIFSNIEKDTYFIMASVHI